MIPISMGQIGGTGVASMAGQLPSSLIHGDRLHLQALVGSYMIQPVLTNLNTIIAVK